MDPGSNHKDNDQSQQIHQSPLVATEIATDGLRRTARGSRRPSERDVLSQLRTWLLEDYVAPYCRALASTRIFRHCYWIDALDGVTRAQLTAQPIEKSEEEGESRGGASQPPTVAKGRGRKKGTPQALHEYPPVLQPVLKLSQALALESRSITLYSLFLAGGSSNARSRRESHTTKDASNDNGPGGAPPLLLPKASSILPQSWLEAASQILPVIEQSPAIFLLNPLAPLLFTENDLIPLYRRATPSELCLFLSHKQIIAHLQATRTPSQTVATTLTTLLRTDRWKTLVPDDQDTGHRHEGPQYEQAITGFIELLSTSLKRHFAFPVQAMAIPILVGPATVENAPYTLLFATKRQDSLFSMNDAIFRYCRRLEECSYSGVLGEEWFLTQLQNRYDQTRQQLTQRILQQGRAQRARRWPDLRQQILLTRFGQFPIQDYDISIQQLLLSGDVSCSWRGQGQAQSLRDGQLQPPRGGQGQAQSLRDGQAQPPRGGQGQAQSLRDGQEQGQSLRGQRVPGNEDTLTWRL